MDTNEIERQGNRIAEQTENFYNICNRIITNLHSIGNIAKETSTLMYRRVDGLANRMMSIQVDTKNKFTNLSERMLKYVSDTRGTEAEMEGNLETRDSELNESSESISSVNDSI